LKTTYSDYFLNPENQGGFHKWDFKMIINQGGFQNLPPKTKTESFYEKIKTTQH
jgi:hypothetical protein